MYVTTATEQLQRDMIEVVATAAAITTLEELGVGSYRCHQHQDCLTVITSSVSKDTSSIRGTRSW